MARQGQTDFERMDDEAELARQERTDPDLQAIPRDWYKHARLETGIPVPPPAENKRPVTMRLDPDVVDFFKGQGRGWQTRINAVLRAFVDGQQSPRR